MATPVIFDSEAVVIDNGSGQYKVGFAGEDSPRLSGPTVLGVPEGNDLFVDGEKSDCYIGWSALDRKNSLSLHRPLDRGRVVDWDAMEKLWTATFDHELKSELEHLKLPVLMSVPSKGGKHGRQRIVKTLFESFDLPGVALFSEGLLSLYSTGHVTGLVIEMGEGTLSSVPCFEGHIIPYATTRAPLAGKDLTLFLQRALQAEAGVSLPDSQYEILQDMKERMVYLRPDGVRPPEGLKSTGEEGYELPDGQIITIPAEIRYTVPEMLFTPTVTIGSTPATMDATGGLYGVCGLVSQTLQRCDSDLQGELSSFVMISGGTSTIPGLHARMQRELSQVSQFTKSVKVHADSQRKNGAWMGGSMIASMDQFRNLMITRQEYDEVGENIVLRKHF